MTWKTCLLLILPVACIFCITASGQECGQRDVVAAGRDCERPCGPGGICRKQSRECVCDGLCGLSCLRKRCPLLTAPLNGNVVMNQNDATIGAEATYSCDEGYEISGQTNRVCQANKTWSATQPTCIESRVEGTCDKNDLPINDLQIEFTYPVGSSQNVERARMKPPGTMARFICEHVGYTIVGSNAKVCQEGKWHVPEPTCEKIPCPVREFSGGILEYRDENSRIVDQPHHGDLRIATCPDGHILRGMSQTQCAAGVWLDELPTCEQSIPLCNIETIANGNVTLHDDGHSNTEDAIHGVWRHFTCEQGYTIVGEQRSQCLDGEWTSEKPSCVEESCPAVANNGDYQHIYYQGIRSPPGLIIFPAHTTLEVDCAEGRVTEGPRISVCRKGMWDPPRLLCLPVATSCPDPGVPENGIKIGSDYSYDDIVSFDCNLRYILEGQSSLRCQVNGTWSAPRPTCRLIQCRRPDEPSNGLSDAIFEYYGQQGTIRFSCDNGYTLRGSGVITCDEHEKWSPPPPLCLGQCRIPSCPSNGRWTMYGNSYHRNCRTRTMVDPGFHLTYECNDGFFKCQQIEPVCNDRVWEPSTRNLCVPIGCNSVRLPDSQLTVSYTYDGGTECFHPTLHQQQTVIEYSCNLGYKIRDGDPRQATCVRRSWLPQRQPVCVEVTCPYIQFPFGSVTYQQNGPYTSTRGHTALARFHCIVGYRLEGHIVSCNNGIWNDTIPTCEEVRCQTNQLENGAFEYRDIDSSATLYPHHGDIRNAICDRGYVLQGAEEAQCWDGEWESEMPICIEEPCNKDDLPTGDWEIEFLYPAGVNADTHLMKPPFTEARFRCTVIGYVITEGEVSTCRRGEWNGQNPSCESSTCETFRLKNGRLEYSDSNGVNIAVPKHGDYMIATCDEGYHLQGATESRCWEGEWEDPQPTCEENPCRIFNEEDVPSYLEVIYTAQDSSSISPTDGFVPGRSVANFTCRENGTRVQGNSQRTCKRGNWRGIFPECENGTCPVPGVSSLVETFVGSDYTPLTEQEIFREGEFITSRCVNPKAQQLQGSVTRRCEEGEWSGDPSQCEPTNFVFSVGNTILQNVTENGTVIVYPVSGYVTINCYLNGLEGIITMHYQGTSSVIVGTGRNRRIHRIYNPSPSYGGRYRCESNGRSHSITILFKAIACPVPSQPTIGAWRHNRSPFNRDGSLGYILTETVSLICPSGYTSSNPTRSTCTHHGTWDNTAQRCIRD